MPSVVARVAHAYDDGTGNSIAQGHESVTTWAYYGRSIGQANPDPSAFRNPCLRFRVYVDQGTQLTSAILELCSYLSTGAGTPIFLWQAHASDNSPRLINAASYLSQSAALTTASKLWTVSESWTDGLWYSSPDLKEVIQEVLDRPGWVSGAYMMLFGEVQNTVQGHRAFKDYELGSATAAKLTLTWGDYQKPQRLRGRRAGMVQGIGGKV